MPPTIVLASVVSWELEDLSFKLLEPDAFREIQQEVATKRRSASSAWASPFSCSVIAFSRWA